MADASGLIDRIGRTVTLRHITGVTYNEYDEESGVVTSDSTQKVYIRDLTKEDIRQVDAGLLKGGERVVYFRPDVTVSDRDLVTIDNKDWEIVKIVEAPEARGRVAYVKAFIRLKGG